MRGAVVQDDQRDLFGELAYRALGTPPRPNQHGVFQPDERLAVFAQVLRIGWEGQHKARPRLPIAWIDLVDLRADGWLFAYGYSLSACGGGFAPAIKWRDTLRPTRQEAIDAARHGLAKAMATHHGHERCKLGRLASAWLQAGCPADFEPPRKETR